MPLRPLLLALFTAAPLWLGGCDLLGIEPASTLAARKEAESKAVGAGCRHAARSVEQCYGLNKRADKAAVFAGWKEMNDYMRENNIEAVPAPPETKAGGDDAQAGDGPSKSTEKSSEKPAEKPADKPADKPATKAAPKKA